jgi:hypothetical protein
MRKRTPRTLEPGTRNMPLVQLRRAPLEAVRAALRRAR